MMDPRAIHWSFASLRIPWLKTFFDLGLVWKRYLTEFRINENHTPIAAIGGGTCLNQKNATGMQSTFKHISNHVFQRILVSRMLFFKSRHYDWRKVPMDSPGSIMMISAVWHVPVFNLLNSAIAHIRENRHTAWKTQKPLRGGKFNIQLLFFISLWQLHDKI